MLVYRAAMPRGAVVSRALAVSVSVVLLALAGGGAAVAWQQREVAGQWRERAVAREDERDEALGRGEALQRQLDEVAASLSTSEADVAALEERIRSLADEKAQAEDTATTVQVQRDAVVDLTQKVAASVEALDSCVTRLFDLQSESVQAFNRAAAGEQVDVEPLNAALEDTTGFCNAARAAAAEASAAAQALPR
jgi:chromosome segregation ATPase